MSNEGGGAKYIGCPKCDATGMLPAGPFWKKDARCPVCSGTGKASMLEPINMKAPPWRDMHPKKGKP